MSSHSLAILEAIADLKVESQNRSNLIAYQSDNQNEEASQAEENNKKDPLETKDIKNVQNKAEDKKDGTESKDEPSKNDKETSSTPTSKDCGNNETTSTELCCEPNLCGEIITPLVWRWQDILVEIHGAAATEFSKTNGQDSSFDLVDFNPLLLANYKDWFLLRAAVDFSITENGDTDTSLDFANINWFINDFVSLSAGKFDSGIGQFVQNISPRWINKLPSVPIGFDSDEAAPQSEIGIQMRGGFPVCDMKVNYSLSLSNGPRALIDTTNSVIDHIATGGFTAATGNYVTGGRLGFLPIPLLEIGFSLASGKLALYDLADNSTLLQKGRDYNAIGADIAYQLAEFNFRGEIIRQKVKAQIESIAPPASKWQAWYLQLAYRIPTTKLEPVLRYGRYRTPFDMNNQRQWVAGLNYWFTPSIVAKFAYELNDGQDGTVNDANVLLFQLAFGF